MVPQLRPYFAAKTWSALQTPFRASATARCRSFEYPWIFYEAGLQGRAKLVHIGDRDAGFRTLLSRKGHDVVAALPSAKATGHAALPCEADCISTIDPLESLPSGGFDACYAISAIERLEPKEQLVLIKEVARCLRPGGLFVATISLFLNLIPFSKRAANPYGCNINVRELIEKSGMHLVRGDRSLLNGYDAFDPLTVLGQIDQYLIGDYPALKQCIVLRR